MSRGLGKTQKRILRLLGTRKWKSLEDIQKKLWWRYKDSDCWPGSAYISIYRAVKTLEKRGLVETRKAAVFMITMTGQHTSSTLKVRKVGKPALIRIS